MLGIFRKSKLRTAFFPRNERTKIEGQVYIKRLSKSTVRGNRGNISDGGIYVEIPNHDLEKGRKVEIVLVTNRGTIKRISRMMGIVIRTDEKGAAMVTYKKEDLNSAQDLQREETMLKHEFEDF